LLIEKDLFWKSTISTLGVPQDYVDDLTQDFYIKVMQSKSKSLMNGNTLNMRYLYFMLKNLCMDFHRRQKRSLIDYHDELDSTIPNDEIEDNEDVLNEFEKLPLYDKLLFHVHAVDGLSFREIERKLNISSRSAWTTVKEVRQTIKSKIK
jgi:RNA polymerase sigma factor (sigma-70 family)